MSLHMVHFSYWIRGILRVFFPFGDQFSLSLSNKVFWQGLLIKSPCQKTLFEREIQTNMFLSEWAKNLNMLTSE